MKKYTVVVMRDKGETLRFTIRKNVVVTVCILAILLPCVAIFGVWSGVSSTLENSLLNKKVRSLQSRVDILEAKEARNENYAAYMNEKSSNVFNNPMRDVIENADSLPAKQQDPMPLQMSEAPVNNDPENIEQVRKHLETFDSLPFNLGMLSVEKIDLKPHKDKKRYYISYDLYNSEKRGQVAGSAQYSLLKNGDINNELALRPSRTTEFSINNYKKTNALVSLADTEFEAGDVIKITLITEDNIVFMQLVPIAEEVK